MSSVTDKRELHVGRYLVKAGVVGGKPKAFVFLGGKRVPDIEFAEATVDATVLAAKKWINEQLGRMSAGRRERHIATQEEYEQFLQISDLASHELEMLHFHARKVSATMTEIAGVMGWDYSAGNLHYGGLGFKIARELGLTPKLRPDESEFWLSVIGSDGDRGDDGHYVNTMHPELVSALHATQSRDGK